ncbi:MAG TPA: cyanophycin synthetase, partial [Verrucomicrobiaceae bacterium]
GLFTSPHLIHFSERIKDAERHINRAEITRGVETLRKICKGWEPHPTFFELSFVLGMEWFKKRKHKWVVLETGLGGRLDATNVLTPEVCVITSISLDHQQQLGATLREIATEKAGIIKPGVPVITLRQSPEVMQVLTDTARERGAPLSIITTPPRGYQIGLFGQHQLWNAALAIAAFKAAGFKTSDVILRQGLKEVFWPARFQRLDEDRVIIDGAHNPGAAETLVRTWQQAFPGEKASVIFGLVTSKDLRGVVKALQPIAARWHFTGFHSPRAADPDDLRATIGGAFGPGVECHVHRDVESALVAAKAGPDRVLVAGSLFLAGEMLAHLRGEKAAFQGSAQ